MNLLLMSMTSREMVRLVPSTLVTSFVLQLEPNPEDHC